MTFPFDFTASSCGQCGLKSATQPATLQFPFPFIGVTDIGRLNPSTRLTS
uniref:Uncharacterized protein n=1 Tax=Arabidopsis thaliana TaxID=3702 RepID=Q8GY33_ARATH|nr:unknown protein [Arabidopsis thaliana]